MSKMSEARIAAAAQWLMEDDTAYEVMPDAAMRAATEMLAAAATQECQALQQAIDAGLNACVLDQQASTKLDRHQVGMIVRAAISQYLESLRREL